MSKPKKLPDVTVDFAYDEAVSAVVAAPAPQVSGLAALAQQLERTVPDSASDEKPQAPGSGAVGYQEFEHGKTYPVGSFVLFPLDQVVENPRNPRVYFPQQDMVDLQLSLSTMGQQEPAKVFFDSTSGKYMLKSGHRRYRALLALGKPHIKAEVVAAKNVLDEFREARELNVEAKGQSHLDDAVRFPELLREYNIDQKTFAQKLNMSEAELSKRLRIGTLPRDVLDKLAEDLPGLEACYQLALIYERRGAESKEFVLKLVSRIQAEQLSVAQLKEIAEAAKRPDATPPVIPAGKRQQPLKRTKLKGDAAGELKAFENRIEVKLERMAPEVRDQLFEKMLALFREAGLLAGS